MNHKIKQDRILKVAIGSAYTRPRFDRPALRQMPRHWTLEESRPPQRYWWQDTSKVIAAVIVLAWLVAIVQTVRA